MTIEALAWEAGVRYSGEGGRWEDEHPDFRGGVAEMARAVVLALAPTIEASMSVDGDVWGPAYAVLESLIAEARRGGAR